MFWFRVGILFCIFIDLIWAIGLISGMLIKITSVANSMTTDPTMNNTLTSYIFLLSFQFAIIGLCLFGFFTCYKIWKNKYMMDAKLRHLFVIWVGSWIGCVLCTFATSIYALIRVKDPQGQLGYMYEMFQKYAIDPKFVASFERYQKDHSCCGIYGPDDWLIVQLRASPGGGGSGMGMFQSGSLDYGFQQNPSTGKCHILQPLIPPGCGVMIMKEVNSTLALYAGLTIVQVLLGLLAAVLAWYCFFYWLEKEVIVIPEDEVSNIVVIEPDDSISSIERRSTVYPSGYLRNSYINPKRTSYYMNSGSLKKDSKKSRPLSKIHHRRASILPHHDHHSRNEHIHHNGTTNRVHLGILKKDSNSKKSTTISKIHHHHTLDYLNASAIPHHHHTLNHVNTSIAPHHHHSRSSYLHHNNTTANHLRSILLENDSKIHHHNPLDNHTSVLPHHEHEHQHHMTHEQTVDKQLKTLGGKVLVKMHVDQKLDEDGKEGASSNNANKPKKATLAIVRNKHKNDPPPPPPPGAHGQTGNLAQDIAALGGGKKVRNKIEDVIITDHPQKKLHEVPKPETLGSISGFGAGSALNNFLEKGGTTEAKQREAKIKAEEDPTIKPIVVGTTARLHGAGGSLLHDIGKKQEKEEHGHGHQHEHEHGHGGSGIGSKPHGNHTMNYLPLHHHHNTTHHMSADEKYHSQAPATLDSLAVHHHPTQYNRSSTGFSLGGIDLGPSNVGYQNNHHDHFGSHLGGMSSVVHHNDHHHLDSHLGGHGSLIGHHDHNDHPHHNNDHPHHNNDHHHHENSGHSAGGRRDRSAYIERSRYLHNEARTRRYLDVDQRSLNNNRSRSRYLREREHHDHDRERHHSRSPRRFRDDDDDDYGYEPPAPPRRSERSRSRYDQRRDDDNARIIYKNPRRLDDDD